MKPFYKLKKARRQALSRWSGFQKGVIYLFRNRVFWIPKIFRITRSLPVPYLESLLDSIIELERREG